MGCNWEEGRYTPVSARDLHGVPQGLKPAGLLAWDGTTEVVPFPQSVWWDERLVCRRLVCGRLVFVDRRAGLKKAGRD